MNERQNILVMKVDAAIEKPSPIKIVYLRALPEIKRTTDAFAVDLQLETSSACSENNFSARRHKIASGLTKGRGQHMISFGPSRLNGNK